MNMSRNNGRISRAKRVRAKISGTAQKPRLSVFRSLTDLRVQLIDDIAGKTLASASIANMKGAKNDVEGATALGAEIAKLAGDLKITEAVFDRAGYKYHGKVKALADAAREGGLQF